MSLKKFQKSITKSVKSVCKNENALIFGLVVVLLVGVCLYSKSKGSLPDQFSALNQATHADTNVNTDTSVASTQNDFNNYASVQDAVNVPASTPTIDPKELLPKDENKEWNVLNPISNVGDGNMLVPGPHNFLKSSEPNRNANLQLRSDPKVPQNVVSPWNNTTIGPDTSRVAFEIQHTPQ